MTDWDHRAERKPTTDWDDRFERKPLRTTAGITVLAVVFMLVLGAGIWGLGVAFSWWRGQGDAVMQKNSAQNWIAAQRGFHQQYNDVQAFRAKIALAQKALDDFNAKNPSVGNGTPYDPLAQQQGNLATTLTGLEQQCMTTTAAYNTDAQSYLTANWRDAGLPETLDPNACKP